MKGYLEVDVFRNVVAHTPLVAVDLVVLNDQGEVLLGKRVNRPAKNFWFTPGGRIRKNESLEAAFRRTTLTELGIELPLSSASFRGVYEHFYDDSFFAVAEEGPGTHYVVVAYTLTLPQDHLMNLPGQQHLEYRWVDLGSTELNVHKYVLDYFERS